MPESRTGEGYALVADIPIDAVRSVPSGFVLEGRGADRGDYRLELRFDLPVDVKTRKVLGELLSQAEVRVSRRNAPPPSG